MMKKIVLKYALKDKPKADDFMAIEAATPDCPKGGVVARVIYVSLDPYVGTRLRGNHMGEAAPEPGAGMIPGAVVGQVTESQTDSAKVGDYIYSMEGGWQDFVALDAKDFQVIDAEAAPLSTYMGPLGMPGLTAWAGVTQLAKVTDGDIFLVNAASGPVAGTAGQIARARGAKTVVGIAGGPEKCAIVTDDYGFDACLDYKTEGWQDGLKQAAPEGITVHFENVGSEMLMLALSNMKLYGRAILCGLAAHYHEDGPRASFPIGMVIGKRAALHGLVVYDYYDRWDKFRSEVAPMVRSGAVTIKEDRVDGLDNAGALMERLVAGKNVGKALVAVGPEVL